MQMISCAGGSTPTVTLWRRDSLHGTVSANSTAYLPRPGTSIHLRCSATSTWASRHIDAQSAAELAAVTGGAGRACGAGVRCSPLSICGPHRLAPQRLRAHHRFRSPARPPVEPPSKTPSDNSGGWSRSWNWTSNGSYSSPGWTRTNNRPARSGPALRRCVSHHAPVGPSVSGEPHKFPPRARRHEVDGAPDALPTPLHASSRIRARRS